MLFYKQCIKGSLSRYLLLFKNKLVNVFLFQKLKYQYLCQPQLHVDRLKANVRLAEELLATRLPVTTTDCSF